MSGQTEEQERVISRERAPREQLFSQMPSSSRPFRASRFQRGRFLPARGPKKMQSHPQRPVICRVSGIPLKHRGYPSHDVIVVEYPNPSIKGPQALQLFLQTVEQSALVFLTSGSGSETLASRISRRPRRICWRSIRPPWDRALLWLMSATILAQNTAGSVDIFHRLLGAILSCAPKAALPPVMGPPTAICTCAAAPVARRKRQARRQSARHSQLTDPHCGSPCPTGD